MKAVIRGALDIWGRIGTAPGYRYQCVEKWGPNLSSGKLLERELFNGLRMECDLREHVQRHVYFWGLYEPAEAFLFTRLLKPGMNVIDAGANVGQYTLLAAHGIGNSGRVHAFEPVPRNFGKLSRHVEMNRLTNVSLNQTALWHESAVLQLSLQADEDGTNNGSFGVGRQGKVIVDAPAIRLDDYVANNSINKIDLMKMDIEGAEPFALRGMEGVLKSHRPMLMMEVNRAACEAAGSTLSDLHNLLSKEIGYQIWSLNSLNGGSPIHTFDGVEQENIFCFSGSPPEAFSQWPGLKSIYRWARTGRLP